MTDVQNMPNFASQNPEIQHPEQQTLFDLQELTVSHVGKVQRLTEEAKKISQMLKDGLLNDSAYHAQEEMVKADQKNRSIMRSEIMKRSGIQELVVKLKDLRSEIKESKASAADYALEITRISQDDINEIEVNGETYTIVKTAKLIKRMKR